MIEAFLGRTRLIATLVLLLTFLGLVSWQTMPRQEDPSFAARFGSLVIPLPGASSLDIERLVLDPVEDRLEEVIELDRVVSIARPGVGIFQLRLTDQTAPSATDAAWEEVRRAIDRATPDLPDEAHAPVLDTQVGDPATAVVMLTGSDDLLALRRAAWELRNELRRVPGVERVTLVGDPGRTVRITLDPAFADHLGISLQELAGRVRSHNITVPGGSVTVDGRNVILRHLGELSTVEQIERLQIQRQNGASVPLSAIATVQEQPTQPPTSRVLHHGRPAVGVSVIAVPKQDLVLLGERIQAALQRFEPTVKPLELQVFAFQPELVRARLGELSGSLLLGMGIVGVVLVLTMGPRMGAIVSVIVPMVAIGTLGIYALGGGVLHQISVAALVLALGLLVDNAIVVAESVQQNIDAGHPQPAMQAIRELAIPLGTATGTTVAAFVPMLLAAGGTAEFTRTIPVMVVIALVLSYVYALIVTPLLAARLLKPSQAGTSRLQRLGAGLARFTTSRPRWVLAAVFIGLLASAGLSRLVPAEFFPMSDRDQLMVTVTLPEGTHASATEHVVQQIVDTLAHQPGVSSTTAFVGGGLPRFYYNLNDSPSSPHHAEIVVTAPGADLSVLMRAIRDVAGDWPEALVIPKRLQQGPPVGPPVQIRLQGRSLEDLETAALATTQALRHVAGARDVRHDLGTGVPTLEFRVHDAINGRLGSDRAALPRATLAQTHGVHAGRIRNGADPINIQVVSPTGEQTSIDRLITTSIRTGTGVVPLMQLADVDPTWQPAALKHRNGVREVVVSAELAQGATFGSVLQDFERTPLELPAGIQVSYGGEAEGSGKANTALLQTLPIGMGLLVFFLLLEFDSFRRLGIILFTVPLAAMGVIPGLALTAQPFGFMSMLGVIALVGIVVNNAIVLLNVIERERDQGHTVEHAVQEAVRLRLRPILLTSLTTVAGMVPLALSSSALWPPLASAMISGLLASTVLTLLAVPALYAVLFDDRPRRRRWWLPLALLVPAAASAAPMTLQDVLDRSNHSPQVVAIAADATSARRNANAAWLDSTTPILALVGQGSWLQSDIAIDTPLGPIVQQPKQQRSFLLQARQSLLDPSGWAAATARSQGAKAQRLMAARTQEVVAAQAADRFFDALLLEAQIQALEAQATALTATAAQAHDLVDAGLSIEVDLLRVNVALANVQQALLGLHAQRQGVLDTLQAQLGLDEPIEPVFDGIIGLPSSKRPDLEAARWAQRAAQSERAAHAASMLPRVTADLSWQGNDNPTLVKSSWMAAGVQASWTLGAGRIARVHAASARARARSADLDAAQRQRDAQVAQAQRMLQVRDADIVVREISSTHAARAAAILQERYQLQLAPLTDVLTAQAELAAQRTALQAAQIERTRAVLTLALAGGSG